MPPPPPPPPPPGNSTQHPHPKSPESLHSLERRDAAARILQSYEQLSWFSLQRGESLTQTRQHFQNIVHGYTDEDEAALVHWRTDGTAWAEEGDDRRGSVVGGKGKARVSYGGGDGVAGGNGSAKKGRSGAGDGVN